MRERDRVKSKGSGKGTAALDGVRHRHEHRLALGVGSGVLQLNQRHRDLVAHLLLGLQLRRLRVLLRALVLALGEVGLLLLLLLGELVRVVLSLASQLELLGLASGEVRGEGAERVANLGGARDQRRVELE